MNDPLKIGVVGIGTIGSQVAWQLARRGANVVGFEASWPGHGDAAAGGDNRIFRSAHFEDTRYIPILRRSDQLFDELAEETGFELRGFPGCVLMGPPEGQMATVLASIQEHSLDVDLMDARELHDRFPQFRADPDDVAVFDRRAGYIRPELTVYAAAKLARGLGAEILSNTKVTAIEPERDSIRIHTETSEYRVDRVVVTVGAWARKLVPSLAEVITSRRPISAWFLRTGIASNPAPTFIRTAPRHFYGAPAFDGISYKIGLSVVDHLVVDEPDTVQRTVRNEELEPFRELIAKYLPALEGDPIRTATYLESYTEDSRPIVGTVESDERVVVLAGFSGHGFKISAGIGEIGADLAIDGGSRLPIDFLSRQGFDSRVAV